jgi:plastocyanin
MRTLLMLTMMVCWSGAAARAGNITGTVHAEGKAGLGQDASDGRYASHEFKFVPKVDYASMRRDFVIYIDGPLSNAPAMATNARAEVATVKVSQKRAMFAPHVLPVMAGTTVEWPNKDDIYHNVFSYSEAKPFDLGLYKDSAGKAVTFDKPGQVDVFCSIHANMSCVVLVLQNPYFAVTDDRGGYTITNVPPGTYRLKAWHERLPPQTMEITVPETGAVKADFTMGITGLPTE